MFMRTLYLFSVIILLITGCKPKEKGSNVTDLLTKDSTKNEIKAEKKDSPKEVIIGKWRMKESSPAPTSEEEKTEMLNSVIEFTNDGKILVTSKGETKQEASFTLSMDNKYMLSVEGNKNDMDSIFIEEANPDRLVLVALKDKRRLVLEPVR